MNRFLLFLAFITLNILSVKSQNIQNYVVTAGSNESLIEDASGWTTLLGANSSLSSSPVTNIGFEVWFMGQRFTQFSVNDNGILRFGATQIVPGGNTAGIAGNARVCAFASTSSSSLAPGDLFSTESNGDIKYKLMGTAPNRILVVDWNNIRMKGDETSSELGKSRFQIHIKETASGITTGGLIKIIYGKMRILEHVGTSATCKTGTRTGIGYGTSATEVVFLNTDNHPSVTGANLSYGTSISACNDYFSQ